MDKTEIKTKNESEDRKMAENERKTSSLSLQDRNILILYAGETGNSEDLAKRVCWEARRRHFNACMLPIDAYPIGSLVKENIVIFICSTTGQGDEPKPLRKFWKFIMKRGLPSDALSTVLTAVIGLGDSSYIKYNVVAKKLYKRLQSLGAQLLTNLCLGDDQHELGFDAAVEPWLEILWDNLLKKFPLPTNSTMIDADILPKSTYSRVSTKEQNDSNQPVSEIDRFQVKIYDETTPFLATVLENKRLTADDHFQDVRFVRMQISDETSLQYSPGDVVYIQPENSDEDVNEFLSLLNLNADDTFSLIKNDESVPYNKLYDRIPDNCSMRELVTRFLSIHDMPKRFFFELLWKFSENDLEKTKLKEFATTAGQQDLYTYCYRPKRNILEVLSDFADTAKRIPFEYLFDLIPAIKPRAFSIASSLLVHPREIHMLVAVVNYKTILKKPRTGLCSNYIANLQLNQTVRLWTEKTTLILPDDKTALIMIGPGTGVAPFRSIIQERTAKDSPANFLFFGCRNKAKDYFFEQEWNETCARGLMYLYVAFSRDNQAKKVYVQTKLMEERSLIWQLISKCNAHIIVAGNSRQMPQDVRQTLIKILELEASDGLKETKAEKVIEKFEDIGKLQYDCWS